MIKPLLRRVKKLYTNRKRLVKRDVGNHVMYIDSQDRGIGRTLRNQKPGETKWEEAFVEIIKREVEPGMTVLEVGANIGYLTLIMAEHVGPQGKVYALEPDPDNCKILRKNVAANGYEGVIEAHQMGVSNVTEDMKFYVSDASNLHSVQETEHSRGSIDVKMTRIDDFVGENECVNFMKMDIEGHEVEAVEGMRELVHRCLGPIRILIEVHPHLYSETHSFREQLEMLVGAGFTTKYVISAAVARPEFFVERGYEPFETLFEGGWYRGIYRDVDNEHMIEAVCGEHDQYIEHRDMRTSKIVRGILLEKTPAAA